MGRSAQLFPTRRRGAAVATVKMPRAIESPSKSGRMKSWRGASTFPALAGGKWVWLRRIFAALRFTVERISIKASITGRLDAVAYGLAARGRTGTWTSNRFMKGGT